MTGPVLAVDQGTSGTKALVICPERGVIGTGFAAVHPRYPSGGLAEADPAALYDSVVSAGRHALAEAREPVVALGLAGSLQRQRHQILVRAARVALHGYEIMWWRRVVATTSPVGRCLVVARRCRDSASARSK